MRHTHPGFERFDEEGEILEAIRKAYRHDHNIMTMFAIIDARAERAEARIAELEADEPRQVEIISFLRVRQEYEQRHARFESGAGEQAERYGQAIALIERLLSKLATFKCKYRNSGIGGNDPQDCAWPECGCDPAANKVLDHYHEMGLFTRAERAEAERDAMREASDKLGSWLSAALEDPGVCEDMKRDINAWFAALAPSPAGEKT